MIQKISWDRVVDELHRASCEQKLRISADRDTETLLHDSNVEPLNAIANALEAGPWK